MIVAGVALVLRPMALDSSDDGEFAPEYRLIGGVASPSLLVYDQSWDEHVVWTANRLTGAVPEDGDVIVILRTGELAPLGFRYVRHGAPYELPVADSRLILSRLI